MSKGREGFGWGSDAFELARCLAALRIAVAAVVLISPELHQAVSLAEHPEALGFVPEGVRWFTWLPLTPGFVGVLRVIVVSSAATALLGYQSRTSMAVLTLAGLAVFSLSQRSGAVLHDMHLFWMSALLSTSRCGDVWSLDAWGKRSLGGASAYATAVMFARAFLAAVYFFPGFHKLSESGLAWASAQNVIGQMHAKWLQYGVVPAWRPDHWPWLCAAAGAGVLAFELGFGALALTRRWASLAALLGLLFHFSIQVFLFIPFLSLWACYGVLLPWRRILRRSRRAPVATNPGPTPNRLRNPAFLVGSTLLLLIVIQGVRGQTQAWPIACYPTFAWLAGPTLPDLLIEVTPPAGPVQRFTGRERTPRSQQEWGRVFRMSGAWGDPIEVGALRDHASRAASKAGVAIAPGSAVRVLRAQFWTAPERWDEPPRSSVELARFTR